MVAAAALLLEDDVQSKLVGSFFVSRRVERAICGGMSDTRDSQCLD